MTSAFNENDYFFFFDSDSLGDVKTKLYGFAISPFPTSARTEWREISKDAISGCGTYVFVERRDTKIIIRQDFCGDFGIFVYRDDDYFAISNSFFLLVERIKNHRAISINEDYVHQFLSTWIVSLSYSDTAINEIERLPSHAILTIDVPTKKLSREYVDYSFNSTPIASSAGMELLDSWYSKWLQIFRSICSSTPELRIDLSGGFDSRLVFLLVLQSGVNLKGKWIHSLKDGLHTHSADLEIATQIAKRYGFELNDRSSIKSKEINLSAEDILAIEFNTKMMFHKELSHPNVLRAQRRYCIGGYGGETVRPYWDSEPEQFIDQQSRHAGKYRYGLSRRISKATERVIRKSFKSIGEKYKIEKPDSRFYAFNMFRECYSRNHFGKINVEGLLCNQWRISPLLDPELHKLQLQDDRCTDMNLLYAVIFTRYCKELLDFEFEGGRAFDGKTLAYAEAICNEFPPTVPTMPEIEPSQTFIISEIEMDTKQTAPERRAITRAEMDELYMNAFNSPGLQSIIESHLDADYVRVAYEESKHLSYYPLRHIHALVGMAELIQAVQASEMKRESTYLEKLNSICARQLASNKTSMSQSALQGVTARIDIGFPNGAWNAFSLELITDENARVTKPDWFNKDRLGMVIESHSGWLGIVAKIHEEGTLSIALRGKDQRDANGKRKRNLVNYRSFTVNETNHFDELKQLWHDEPYTCNLEVSARDVVIIQVEWEATNQHLSILNE